MKRLFYLLPLLFIMLCLYSSVLAASVPAQIFPGNDASDYVPPDGCIRYQILDSDTEGIHTVTFNSQGLLSPDSPYSFSVTIGTIPGNNFTQVLSWSSTFPIYAVIVNGEDSFNLYQYELSMRHDVDLVPPPDSTGLPSDVNHVSIVFCPNTFSKDPSLLFLLGPLSTVLMVNTIFQIISTLLLGFLAFLVFILLFGSRFNIFGSCVRRFHMKSKKPKNDKCDKKDKHCHKDKDKDCDHKKPNECDKIDGEDCHEKKPDDYCSKKHNPGAGYSLDCNNRSSFPYSNNYHNYL